MSSSWDRCCRPDGSSVVVRRERFLPSRRGCGRVPDYPAGSSRRWLRRADAPARRARRLGECAPLAAGEGSTRMRNRLSATAGPVPRSHLLSRFACRRAPEARVLARRFSVLGERRARSPVGSPVTEGPIRPAVGSTARAPGTWPCLAALAAASRSARRAAAACRARVATRRLTRARASSNASAFMAARVFCGRAVPRPPCSITRALAARRYRPAYLLRVRLTRASRSIAASSSSAASSARSVWATSNRSASLRTASRDAFSCFPRFPWKGSRHDQVFPGGPAIEPAYSRS